MISLDIFLNVAKDEHGYSPGFMGYKPGQAMLKVFTLEVPALDIDNALNKAFHLLNVGDDPDMMGGLPDPQAVAYRAARNRSLSVGDVLVADGVAFAVASFGFDRVTLDPADVVAEASYGATPLGGEPVKVGAS